MRLWAILALGTHLKAAETDNELNVEVLRDENKGTCILRGIHGAKRAPGEKIEFFCINAPEKLARHLVAGTLRLNQVYDTGIQCQQCLGDYHPVTHHKHPTPTSTYGPENCIHTYLSLDRTCIVETKNCSIESVARTNVGFMCVKTRPAHTGRHFFGTNSFKSSQAIDTGIACDQCLSSDISVMPGEEHIVDNRSFLQAKSLWETATLQSLTQRMNAMIHKFDTIMENKREFLEEKKRLSRVLNIPAESRDDGGNAGSINLSEW